MSNRSLQALYYNVSVIGLSGVEDVRGSIGVGKSCLCNRFVRPGEDSYNTDHIYLLSQSDFGGEVVNNVPWLYWGETTRQHPETDQTCVFRVIEQTEFIDDAAFTVLSCGTHEPYHKRCLNLKLKSARKLVYICKDQLGLEDDYPKDYLAEGKFAVDGFIYTFDVSSRSGHSLDRQFECFRDVLNAMPKIQKRRPFIIVTTKNDRACEEVKSDFERFLSRKDIRNLVNNVVVVETSAAEGINVDSAFMMIASLIEKSKTKPRILSYNDAARIRHDEIERLQASLHEKMLTSITSHRSMWREWSLRHDHFLQEYSSVLGTRVVKQMFDHHVYDLQRNHIETQRRLYINQLPKALDDLISSREAMFNCTYVKDMVEHIRRHERFYLWFVESSNSWEMGDNVDRGENKIPVGILSTEEGERILIRHLEKLELADTRNERRKDFLSLLRRNKTMKAGKSLADVIFFLQGEPSYDGLSVPDRIDVYTRYQEELKEKAQAEFHELLLERADLFFRQAMTPVLDEEQELASLMRQMNSEPQYRNLDCLTSERREMVRRHLAHFRRLSSTPLCAPPEFTCPASPCVQSRLFDFLSASSATLSPSSRPLIILGDAVCASEAAQRLRETVGGMVLELHTPAMVVKPDVRLWTGNIPAAALLLLVYRDARSISLLESTVNDVTTSGCPCVVLHLADNHTSAEEMDLLKLRGGQLACQVEGVFAEIATRDTLSLWQKLDNALNRALLAQPKLSIIVAFMCSDLYHPNLVINSIMSPQTRSVPWKQRLYIGEEREVIFMSYFQLLHLLTEQLPSHVHGLILVFWTARKASLASMKAVCNHTPVHWPKLVLGVGVDGREEYLQGGQELAHEMEAHFAHIQPDQRDYRNKFENFLRSCSNAKVVTEDRNRQLMGAPSRRPANHPSTLPPTPVSCSRVQRRKSSAGSAGHAISGHVNLAARKSWHSSNSSHEDTIYSQAESPSTRLHFPVNPTSTFNSLESKKNNGEAVVSMCRQGRDEDVYSSMYEDILSPTTAHLQNDSSSSDAIYAEPLDIHCLASANHSADGPERSDAGAKTASGGDTQPLVYAGTQPFSDGESEYAEVEGYAPGQRPIRHIRICHPSGNKKRQSPPPPPPYPRSTSEADPWERRNVAPEYDEPNCDPESPLLQQQEEKLNLLDHPEFVRQSGERRSHKENKKKSKAGLSASKSFGAGDKIEAKKSAASRGWRSPFRTGSAATAVSPTRAQRSQDSSPRSQTSFVASCTEYVEKYGLKAQGIYRQCGNRNVAETIRQRGKEGHFSEWLSAADVTPHDVATALKLYLRDMPEPLMPLDIAMFREIAALPTAGLRLERLRKAVLSLPLPNQRLLYHLLQHLHKVTSHSEVNDMTAHNLAICWTPTLAVPHNADVSVLLAIPPIQELVTLLIQNTDLILQSPSTPF